MATFLELCERVAEESGGTGRAPATVLGQIGRQKKIVNWTKDAWVKIQNLEPRWPFLLGEFEKPLVAGANSYTSTSWSITRFGDWIAGTLSLFDPMIGREDENRLAAIDYATWRRRWDFGSHDPNRPTEYAFAPDGSVRFGATPDEPYIVRGEYSKTPQILASNGDVPDLPARFHDAIVWRAIMLMSEHDEATSALIMARGEFVEVLSQMQRDLLPPVRLRARAFA